MDSGLVIGRVCLLHDLINNLLTESVKPLLDSALGALGIIIVLLRAFGTWKPRFVL